MELRPYQQFCHNRTIDFIDNGTGHGIVIATGAAGKSLLIARCAEYIYEKNMRAVCLANRALLLEQNFGKFRDKNIVGLVSSGLNSNNYHKPITVASIQTIYNKPHLLGDVDWFLIDESHSLSNNPDSDSRYYQLLKSFPKARIIGFTATNFTLQEGRLAWGKEICMITHKQLLETGYVVPLTNRIKDEPDLSGVTHNGKEYNLQSLSELMNVPELVIKTAKSIASSIVGRKKGLVFCVDRKHAEQVAMALIREGVRADLLLGTMPESQRAQKYADFAGTYIDCLVNVEIATTGVDFPFVDWIACLRSTESLGLWHQIIYRGVRLSPTTDKKNCLLLDYSGNLRKHGGLMNQIWEYMGSTKKKIGKPVKVCPACEEVITVGHESCPACDYIFEKEEVKRELKHTAEADMNSDIEKDSSVKYVTVNNVLYYKHTSKENNENFRIEYQWGKSGSSVSEYLPFDGKLKWQKTKCYHFMKPRAKLMPESIDEALELCKTWRVPQLIKIRKQVKNPKYWEIASVEKWREYEAN